MDVRIFKPRDALLQSYIECIYILQQVHPAEKCGYITFPNIFPVVAILSNAGFRADKESVTTFYTRHTPVQSSIVSKFSSPIFFRYEGLIDEITIYFKPAGIRCFLPEPVSRYSPSAFNLFNPYPDYKKAMREVMEESDEKNRLTKLEKYWAGKFLGPVNPVMVNLLDDMMWQQTEDDRVINKMSEKYSLSRQAIHRLFLDYTGKTPSQFRKIYRFRKALSQHMSENTANRLTQIAYDALYYDQSHMIKEFRSLTGTSPKDFFKKLSRIGKGDIYWQMK